MAFIPAPLGSVRGVYYFSLQGQEVLISHYFSVGGVNATGPELQAFADDLFDAFVAGPLFRTTNELTLQKLVLTNVNAPGGSQVTSTNAPESGPNAEASVNNALALVVSLNTGMSGRSHRGRTFLPGCRATQVLADSNYWDSTYVGDVQDEFEEYLGAVAGMTPHGSTPAAWCVASYYELDPLLPVGQRTVPRAEAILTPITSVSGRTRIATQRRRRPRS